MSNRRSGRKKDETPSPTQNGSISVLPDHASSSAVTDTAGLDVLQVSVLTADEAQKERQGTNSTKYCLKLQPGPPTFPFVNVFFPIQVYLVDKKDQLKLGWHLRLNLELLYENGQPVQDQSTMEIGEDSSTNIDTTGSAKLKIRLCQLSMLHENRNFRLRISSADSLFGPIEPVTSSIMTVIRHRLKVLESLPNEWYKDEGGRDKCLMISIALVDENDKEVKTREVPLKMVLVYENNSEVKNQSVLKPMHEMSVVIRKGRATYSFRIEEVSKNHQKQPFRVKVQPDVHYDPANYDISSDYTSPVLVLSKRNKRPRQSESVEPRRISTGVAPMSANGAGNSFKGEAMDALTTHASIEPLDANTLKLLKSSTITLSKCIHDLAGWSQMVAKNLSSIEWQHVGEINEHSGPIPLYRCPSCWTYTDSVKHDSHSSICMLHRALTLYETTVRETFQTMAKIAESEEKKSGVESTVLLEMPPVTRQASIPMPPPPDEKYQLEVGPGLEQPQLVRGNSTAEFGPFDLTRADDTSILASLDESRVHSVMWMLTPHGFPAFSNKNDPLGFYQLVVDRFEFKEMASFEGKLDERMKDLKTYFLDYSQTKPEYILTRERFVTLENLKEQLVLLFLQTQSEQTTYN